MDKEKLLEITRDYGVYLNEEALERFELLQQMLQDECKVNNLTAIKDDEGILIRHFTDSLSVFSCLKLPKGAKCIDVGCGAGFPGLPLLIAEPSLHITFLDSTEKKLKFIRDYLKEAHLSAETLHARAEEAGKDPLYREKFDFAFSRAVASQGIAAEYCLPFVKKSGKYITMKTERAEIEENEAVFAKFGGKIADVVSFKLPDGSKRCIGVVEKTQNTPEIYPRKESKIRNSNI